MKHARAHACMQVRHVNAIPPPPDRPLPPHAAARRNYTRSYSWTMASPLTYNVTCASRVQEVRALRHHDIQWTAYRPLLIAPHHLQDKK